MSALATTAPPRGAIAHLAAPGGAEESHEERGWARAQIAEFRQRGLSPDWVAAALRQEGLYPSYYAWPSWGVIEDLLTWWLVRERERRPA